MPAVTERSSARALFERMVGTAPRAALLVRLSVGAVFLSEGIQKLVFPDALGVGRFIKIGIPAPALMAQFVGAVEIVCGLLVAAGLLARLASLPLIIVMLVALVTTKLPILMKSGFLSMAHEARTDWAMLLGATFVLLAGSGPLSLDALLAARLAASGSRAGARGRRPASP